MRRHFKLLVPAAVIACVGMGPAVPAFAGGPASHKAPLVHNAEARCTGGLLGPPRGGHGFAVINAHHGVVRAQVLLRHARPHTTYRIELVQTPSGTDCNDYDGSLTTNGHGNGNASMSVPRHPGDTGAFVGLFYGNIHDFYNTPVVLLR